jgi:pimeloyl-ACP methyl ester carboxylesterase
MNSVLGKPQSQDQKRLVRLVAGLMQTGEVEFDHPDSGPRARRIASSAITRHNSRLASVKLRDGRRLAYAEYGDLQGDPVLMIQPTTTPTQPEPVRKAMAQCGLHVIAPYRPGSGLTDNRSPKDGPKALAEDYLELLDALEIKTCTLVGHCSGGLYALAAAQRFGDRARRTVLLDTGAPFSSVAELFKLPSAPRRTFLPARLFPQALIAPHRMVAADFNKDDAGERRTVEYFFEGSPAELERVRSRSYFYDVTRDNIAYSFENVPRLVEDVCRWVSNWERLVQETQVSVHFVHGSDNTIFLMEKLEAFVRNYDHTTLTKVEGEGQLLLYSAPDRVAQAIRC